MNIFYTSECPIESANYLCTRRTVKMILESAQMLSAAIYKHWTDDTPTPLFLYKPTHTKHPSTMWAAENREQWLWLFYHAQALCQRYTEIYSRRHKSQAVLNRLIDYLYLLPKGEFRDPPNCTENKAKGISFKHISDVKSAYRLYLSERFMTDANPAVSIIITRREEGL